MTFIVSNPSKQHAAVYYRLYAKETSRLVEVVVPFEGSVEIDIPDIAMKDAAQDLDLQCRGLGLKFQEK